MKWYDIKYWKWLVICAVSMLALSFFCRCTTTKYVPKIEYHEKVVNKTDSFLKADSVWLHDSISVYIRGDTIFKDKYHTTYKDRYVYRNKSDTLLVRDSIPYRVEIEKQLSKSDRVFLDIGKITSALLFVGILGFLGWIFWKLSLHKRS